jgi:hypothetical protein
MRSRFVVVGTLVGATVMFVWQTVSNAALPWHMATMTQFTDDSATAHAIRAAAAHNGVYYSKYGVLAAVSITPSFTDQSVDMAMGPKFGKQAGINVIVTLALVLLVLRLPLERVVRTATAIALAGFAASAVLQLSDWNWYGFGASYALVNVVDTTFCFFLVGATLAALRARFEPVVKTEERPGVKAQGSLPTSGPAARV